MTIGKITGSQQDLLFVKVRPEDGSSIETIMNSTAEESVQINSTAGQEFTTTEWFDRIKIPISSTNGSITISIWDSPAKVIQYYSLKFSALDGGQVIHFTFDPLPPGDYYWEMIRNNGIVSLTKAKGSTYSGAYSDNLEQTGFSWKSKIMLTPAEVLRPVAIKGDEVDGGITTINEGSNLGAVQVGQVIGNIARVGDKLQNGGEIRTGAWNVQFKE